MKKKGRRNERANGIRSEVEEGEENGGRKRGERKGGGRSKR